MTANIPRLALTCGEPAGIGPDLCVQLAQKKHAAQIVVVGSKALLLARAQLLDLPLALIDFSPNTPRSPSLPGQLWVHDIALPAPCTPGTLNPANAPFVLNTLKTAFDLCASNICDALVTGPIHKALLHRAHAPFYGHTEFLSECAGGCDVLMTFFTPEILLGLLTTHCSLKDVSDLLTSERLRKAIILLQEGLARFFNKPNGKITVCGLNPHAGEAGTLGTEEKMIITPVLEALKTQGFLLEGPISADTAFTPTHRQNTDAILAMYHDQGLAPLKALYFHEIVNVTLGLPFLRTSVDHGTALSLAGSTRANVQSLEKAVEVATEFCYATPCT